MEGRGVGKWEAIFKFRKACICIGREKKKENLGSWNLPFAFSKLGQGKSCLLEWVGRELVSV